MHGSLHRSFFLSHWQTKPCRPLCRLNPLQRLVYCRYFVDGSPKLYSNGKPFKWIKYLLIGGLGIACGWVYNSSYARPLNRARNDDSFSPYILKSREQVSSTSSIFTLEPFSREDVASEHYRGVWAKGLWSVQIKQPQLQIARPYTPLPPLSGYGGSESELRILIREEPNGEVSGYLHRLPLGATIEVRGPHVEFCCPDDVASVIFVAGGTGIAAALQTAFVLSKTKEIDKLPEMHILWANRRREDCEGGQSSNAKTSLSSISRLLGWPKATTRAEDVKKSLIVEDLERLQEIFRGRLHVDYFVDEEKTVIDRKILNSVQNRAGIVKTQSASGLIAVAGPDGFLEYIAGPKLWKDGINQQGEVGGLLKDAQKSGWQTHKC